MTVHDHTLDPSHEGSVIADIGGDVGALVLYTGPAQCGVEIDIEPIDRPGPRTHVAVRERRLPSGSTFAAFYPGLVAGEYALHVPSPDGPRRVVIEGGAITEIAWEPSVV
jgi:hypothetical protein